MPYYAGDLKGTLLERTTQLMVIAFIYGKAQQFTLRRLRGALSSGPPEPSGPSSSELTMLSILKRDVQGDTPETLAENSQTLNRNPHANPSSPESPPCLKARATQHAQTKTYKHTHAHTLTRTRTHTKTKDKQDTHAGRGPGCAQPRDVALHALPCPNPPGTYYIEY